MDFWISGLLGLSSRKTIDFATIQKSNNPWEGSDPER
jgi:hypothetical protein